MRNVDGTYSWRMLASILVIVVLLGALSAWACLVLAGG